MGTAEDAGGGRRVNGVSVSNTNRLHRGIVSGKGDRQYLRHHASILDCVELSMVPREPIKAKHAGRRCVGNTTHGETLESQQIESV